MSILKRFHSRKKWSQIYVEAAEEERERFRRLEEKLAKKRNENMDSMLARGFVAKNLGVIIRKKLKTRTFSVRTTLHNITEPEENNAEWGDSSGHQVCCDVCISPVVFDGIFCSQCSNTYHRNCINGLFPGKKKQFKAVPEVGEATFTCYTCRAGNTDDMNFYERTVDKLETEQHLMSARRILADFILAYVVRSKFLRTRRLIVKFQASIRRKFQRRRFIKYRREHPHVVKLNLHEIPSIFQLDGAHDLFGHTKVLLTLVDTMRKTQLLRFEKGLTDALEDGFILPGVTQSLSIVLTIVKHSDIHGQTHMTMKNLEHPNRMYVMNQELSGKLPYVPSTQDGGGSTVGWDISHVQGHYKTWCDYLVALEQYKLDGIIAEELRSETASIDSSHRSTTSANTRRSSIMSAGAGHSRTGTSSGARDQNAHRSNQPISIAAFTNTFKYTYMPQSFLRSACGSVLAPSLDVLRKAPDQFGFLLKSNKEVKRATRYWICMMDLHIMFYAFYGDSTCRIEFDLQTATITNEKHVALVRFEDKRFFHLEFETPGEASHFTFVHAECMRPQWTGSKKRKPF